MNSQKVLTAGQIIFTIVYLLFWPGLMIFLSGDWLWTEGWLFCAWFLATTAGVTIYLYYKDPALLLERYRTPGTGNQKSWDKLLLAGIMIVFITWIVIIPLDSKRFSWTIQFPISLK